MKSPAAKATVWASAALSCQLAALACSGGDTAIAKIHSSPEATLPRIDAGNAAALATTAPGDQACGGQPQAQRFVDLPCDAAHDLPECEPVVWVELDSTDASLPCEFDVAQFGVGRRGEDISPTEVVVWAGVDGSGSVLPELDGPAECTPQLDAAGYFVTSGTAAALSLCSAACNHFDQLLLCVRL